MCPAHSTAPSLNILFRSSPHFPEVSAWVIISEVADGTIVFAACPSSSQANDNLGDSGALGNLQSAVLGNTGRPGFSAEDGHAGDVPLQCTFPRQRFFPVGHHPRASPRSPTSPACARGTPESPPEVRPWSVVLNRGVCLKEVGRTWGAPDGVPECSRLCRNPGHRLSSSLR